MNIYLLQETFPLGRVVITPNALDVLVSEDIHGALQRHASRDWGEVCAADKAENELSLKEGFRILSAYRDSKGSRFWIITEADRSVTTILLPEDY